MRSQNRANNQINNCIVRTKNTLYSAAPHTFTLLCQRPVGTGPPTPNGKNGQKFFPGKNYPEIS